AGALGIGTASDQEGHPDGALEGGDGAEVVIVSRGPGLAFGAIAEDRSQVQGVVRLRPWSSWSSWLGHPKAPGSDFHLLSTSADPVTFATVVFFDRSERGLDRGRDRGDVLSHLGTFARLGQEPGDREVGLVPRLVVDHAL